MMDIIMIFWRTYFAFLKFSRSYSILFYQCTKKGWVPISLGPKVWNLEFICIISFISFRKFLSSFFAYLFEIMDVRFEIYIFKCIFPFFFFFIYTSSRVSRWDEGNGWSVSGKTSLWKQSVGDFIKMSRTYSALVVEPLYQ